MNKPITALIADDEPLVRERLQSLFADRDDFELVAQCGNGLEAIASINHLQPQAVFLDIQMPEKNGFEVLRSLKSQQAPVVVFVTAYSDYAIDAFEAQAVDYILKPIDPSRFYNTLDMVRERIVNKQMAEIGAKFKSLMKLQLPDEKPQFSSRLAIKEDKMVSLLKTEEIDWAEAEGNYVSIHSGNDKHKMRETLNNLEQQLDPTVFCRIHRSYLVNINFVKSLQHMYKGEYVIHLNNGKQLTSSRSYKDRVNLLLRSS